MRTYKSLVTPEKETLYAFGGLLAIAAIAFAIYGVLWLLGVTASPDHCEVFREGASYAYSSGCH